MSAISEGELSRETNRSQPTDLYSCIRSPPPLTTTQVPTETLAVYDGWVSPRHDTVGTPPNPRSPEAARAFPVQDLGRSLALAPSR